MVTVKLTDNLNGQPLVLPDLVIRMLAEWVVEAGVRDSKLAPVELPQELSDQPSLLQDTAIIET